MSAPAGLFEVSNDQGRRFRVRLVRRGDRYGLDDCLVHDKDPPLVEFYDATADPGRFGPRGQFVARYSVCTFHGVVEAGRGLLLWGDVPAWYLDAAAVAAAGAWVCAQLGA